ncbi:hypothetical protein [Aureimonas sp. ME7]|uniref:hypothetical protein n=1 Tax=Aureimonas sp. ME7 TaxID=2744252 RepID=UPI0015F6EBF1|nr:hypothetical protein [Aureimonas sp. ME7]
MAGPVDHCTGWFEGVWGEACCKPHDDAYALGGSLLRWLASNMDLGTCVAAFGDLWSLVNAPAMAIGTTLFGLPFWIRAAMKRRSAERLKGSSKPL